jgi:hypothetical protein
MLPRIALVLTCLLAGTAAQADIFRCVIDGRTTFRDKPCPPGVQQSKSRDANPVIEGCFAVDTPGWESGRHTELMRFGGSAGHYTMSSAVPAGPQSAVVPMRRATPGEILDATRLLGFEVTDGMVLVVPPGTPNQPALPIGLYRGRDAYRDLGYFFYGFFSSGPAKPVPCP